MNKKLIYLLAVSLAFGSSDMKLASSHTTPIETLVSLSKDSDEDVRMAVVANPNTPVEVLIELCKDKEEDVVVSAIVNKKTPLATVVSFVNHKENDVRSAIARNPNLPKESMEILANDSDDGVREALASNVNAGDTILTLLSNDKEADVVKAVVTNPASPSDILERFVNNEDYQMSLAANISSSPAILDKLSDSKYSIGIRMTVAKNSNTALKTMEKMLDNNENDTMFIKPALARNPNATADMLAKLSTFDDFSFVRGATRVGVASNKNTPPEVLDKLGTDENYIVRAIVYKNTKTPVSRLAVLEKDDDFKKFHLIDQNDDIFRGVLGVNYASNTRDTFFLLGRPDIARALNIIHVRP